MTIINLTAQEIRKPGVNQLPGEFQERVSELMTVPEEAPEGVVTTNARMIASMIRTLVDSGLTTGVMLVGGSPVVEALKRFLSHLDINYVEA